MNHPDANSLLDKWRKRSLVAQLAHYSCAARYSRYHYWIGFPTVVVTTVVGSSIFASINQEAPGSDVTKWVLGCVSILGTSLAAAQTFLRFAERAEQHRVAGVRYSALKRKIDHWMIFEPECLRECLEEIRKEWDQLTGDCPILPQDVYHYAESKVYTQPI